MPRKSTPPKPALSWWVVVSIAGTAVAAALVTAVGDGWNPFRTGPQIVVYRDPPCRCCVGWIQYLRGRGFDVQERITSELSGTRRRFGVPEALASCHTAVVDGYVIEGHVPAEDIERLLKERPAVRGLAVPGMPGISPGMEPYSTDQSPYEVLTFGAKGPLETFSRHSVQTP